MTFDHWVTICCSAVVLSVFVFFSLAIFPFREWTEETKRRPRSFISNALFREYWYFIMTPLKGTLLRWDVSPNTITTWGLIFSLAAGWFFARGQFGAGGWLVILASTCDVYDGMLARAKKIHLKSGAFFDSNVDRIGEIGMFYGLMSYFMGDSIWFTVAFLALSSSQVVSYARARAEGLGFDGGKGFFQRAERMIVLSIGMSATPLVDLLWGPVAARGVVCGTVAILAAGSLQTAFFRTIGLFREIRTLEGK